MANELQIPDTGFAGLAALAELGPDRLSRLADRLSREKLSLDLQTLIRRWAQELAAEEKTLAVAIAQALAPLNQERERMEVPTGAFLKLLDDSVQNQASEQWKRQHLAAWNSLSPVLPRLFGPDGLLNQVFKARRLLYERQASMLDARILTEFRPLYNEQATSIRWLVLSNVLVIDYQREGERHELHLTLDSDDLRNLLREINRAQKKSRQAIEQAKRWQVGILTFDTGESA